jgi:hypothetical protein
MATLSTEGDVVDLDLTGNFPRKGQHGIDIAVAAGTFAGARVALYAVDSGGGITPLERDAGGHLSRYADTPAEIALTDDTARQMFIPPELARSISGVRVKLVAITSGTVDVSAARRQIA